MGAEPEAYSGAALPDVAHSLVLARRARDGDERALNELLERYQERLRRIVRVRMGAGLRRELESMDVVQEALIVAARKIDTAQLRTHASILSWMASIAENQLRDAHDHATAQRRDRRREVPLQPAGPPGDTEAGREDHLAANDTLPEDRAARGELAELVDEAMAELSEEHREVILLRDYSGASWDEVRVALGRASAGAVQELHRRAWIRLRRLVRPRI